VIGAVVPRPMAGALRARCVGLVARRRARLRSRRPAQARHRSRRPARPVRFPAARRVSERVRPSRCGAVLPRQPHLRYHRAPRLAHRPAPRRAQSNLAGRSLAALSPAGRQHVVQMAQRRTARWQHRRPTQRRLGAAYPWGGWGIHGYADRSHRHAGRGVVGRPTSTVSPTSTNCSRLRKLARMRQPSSAAIDSIADLIGVSSAWCSSWPRGWRSLPPASSTRPSHWSRASSARSSAQSARNTMPAGG